MRRSNGAAAASVLAGLLGVAAFPAAIEISRQVARITLPQGVGGAAVACSVLGLLAILLARRARVRIERTLGRAGEGTARIGRVLGVVAVCIGLGSAGALAVYGLLLLYGG